MLSGCADEPPPERYTQTVEAEGDQQRVSLKDMWDNGTTVHRAALPPAKVVYVRPPEKRRAPPAPSISQQPVPQQKPASPDLAISSPPVVTTRPPTTPAQQPTPARPLTALTERDLQQDTTRCGVGVDCLALLQAMIADPKQSWMMHAPTPAEFANGTRLFAYRAIRKTLDCGKLRFAGAELEWAMDTFSRDVNGMDAAHRARVTALAAEVRGELETEIEQRC